MDKTDSPSLKIKCIYNSSSVNGVKHLLNILSQQMLYSLAQTACNGKMSPENKEEALEIILLNTRDIDRFFGYRCITKDVLMQYIFSCGQTIEKNATQQQLIASVKQIWTENSPTYEEYGARIKSTPAVRNSPDIMPTFHESPVVRISVDLNSTSPISSSSHWVSPDTGHTIRSDIFAYKFCEWFYSHLNNSPNNSLKESKLHSSMFCLNASIDLYIHKTNQNFIQTHADGSSDCEKALHNLIKLFCFMLTPNLDTGTQAIKSRHGLIQVLCCGTLHIGHNFVGIFEHEFALVQSPIDKTWQIFKLKGNFKENMFQLPTLPHTNVFEIEIE